MALETVVFQQDPFINYAYKDLYNIWGLDENDHHDDDDEHGEQQIYNLEALDKIMSINSSSYNSSSSSPDDHGSFSGGGNVVPASVSATPSIVMSNSCRRKRRRTTKSFKNKEEMENQRMTHIAVERNRRRQMNDYLAVLRSLMPPSYAQRGDQASIVGGAINFVKELEQLLQFLESHKQVMQQQHSKLLFTDFFTFPQYSTSCPTTTTMAVVDDVVVDNNVDRGMSEKPSRIADIEVTMAESHANIKLLTRRQPKQLLTLITGFHSLSLTVLHLNITTVHQMILFSFSVKVEDDCQLTSANDIATAVHELVGMIQEDAMSSSS